MYTTLANAKAAAATLRRQLNEDGVNVSHSRALEIVAAQLGFADWNTAHATLSPTRALLGTAVPVLRIHDEQIARRFYTEYLEFDVEWEHRFELGMPLYVRIRRDSTVIDLSEHHGDGTPGTVAWIPVGDVEALYSELGRRGHPLLNPGIDHQAPGGPTMVIIDPFGNVLRFCQADPLR